MRVLVVDDQLSMRAVVCAALREIKGVELYEAADGAQAWASLRSGGIDMVVSDWMMPVKDGISLLRDIRADENLKGLPVILLTGEGKREQVVEAIKSGATDYIVKPFAPQTLVEKVQRALARLAAA
ncbi:Chemotaxis protein CheY [Burkholderiales bacterium]|nr:MAG: response regulator [Burkholderiales bacterium]CAG0977790.1 Chemotaxis protein CheY [Burkholderiales bacterium]